LESGFVGKGKCDGVGDEFDGLGRGICRGLPVLIAALWLEKIALLIPYRSGQQGVDPAN
jgi:hypothetical protein